MMSAPARAMPLAMAATLWTAAILTLMGLEYSSASFKAKMSCRRSSIE